MSFKDYLSEQLNEAIIVVTNIKDIEGIQDKVNSGGVTYRGLGMGKKSDNFYKASGGKSGMEITIGNKKYFITKDDFDKLGGVKKIKFKAPVRKER